MRLHAKMVVMLLRFNQTVVAYRKKFKTIFYGHKKDKMTNDITGNNR